MITPEVIEFVNIKDLYNNISLYKDIFIRDGVLVFRNANLSHEDHIKVHRMISEALGAHKESNLTGYTENHSRIYEDAASPFGANEIMLPWHIEHPTFDNPIVLGTWNMHNFKTDNENGKTYFVNSKLLYEQLPDYLKSFLNKCVIYDNEANAEAKPTHNMIEKHWITGEPVIRTSFVYEVSNTNQSLYSVDGKDPSEEDFQTYAEGIDWLHDQLYYNTDIRIVHKWKQGDLVVPDMFLMYHAVTGGFSPNDREFVGIWSRKNREDMITI